MEKTFRWQLILPKTRLSTVFKELNDSPTGDNFGVMKTLQKVHEGFYWNNVRSYVEKCCRTCDPYAARKETRKCTKGRLQLYNVGEPFEQIAFNILGPLLRSSDGNNNILSNGMVERFNRTILSNFSLLVYSNQQDWFKKLPFFLLAYRSAVYETTGYSPSQMLFGRDFRQRADLLFSRPPGAPLASEEYVKKLQARMEKIMI
ncbi:retrovirus-related Pol polyprotein from transposon 412 [Trichonephila clavipes]|nr:retrovirus-related Pol polyprotein from transposon 412 [Trichonephila clavipes]